MANSRRAWSSVFLAALMVTALPLAAAGQAIIGTFGGSNQAIVFPSPNTGLPSPTQTPISGLPTGVQPHGIAYFGADNGLVSDFNNSRVFVVRVSTASVLSTITTTGRYNGTGTIEVSPGLNFALAAAGPTLCRISAPFAAGSTLTPLLLPGMVATYQTQAIAFNAAGRAFVYHTTGISVLDPPYTSIAFTIPAVNTLSGAIAITPDGNTLLATDPTTNVVRIYTAPFSAASVPALLPITGATFLDGIVTTPDGTRALAVAAGVPGLWSIAAPFTASSTVELIPIPAAVGGAEDIGISPDGQLVILAGQGLALNPNTAFVRAPFTTAGATVFVVTIPGGRGTGAARFVPRGLAPGLTISKSAPATVASGSNITYTITYGNTGALPATNVIIRDPVPTGTTFVSATGGGTLSAGSVVWNIGTVNAGVTGQTVSFTVNVTATSGNISNVNYTIEGTGIPPIPGPPQFTQVGGVGPTVTPTTIPTVTPTGPAAPANIPTLSFPMLALLAAALGIAAILLISRKF